MGWTMGGLQRHLRWLLPEDRGIRASCQLGYWPIPLWALIDPGFSWTPPLLSAHHFCHDSGLEHLSPELPSKPQATTTTPSAHSPCHYLNHCSERYLSVLWLKPFSGSSSPPRAQGKRFDVAFKVFQVWPNHALHQCRDAG